MSYFLKCISVSSLALSFLISFLKSRYQLSVMINSTLTVDLEVQVGIAYGDSNKSVFLEYIN